MEKKFTRNERISAITKLLVENPNRIVNLNTFTNILNAAKSTISEDVVIVRESLEKQGSGKIETVSGASGGIKYVPQVNEDDKEYFMKEICELLRDRERIIPGDFLYMTDLLYHPQIVARAGRLLASSFKDKSPDCIITVETKGIPLAYEVAKCLGVNLVIVRHDNKVTEGATVSINYVSGSTKRIQTMTLSRKAIKKGSQCIFIDDFMKGGGTATGIVNLLEEFNCNLLGIGIFIKDISMQEKVNMEYTSLLTFNGIDQDGSAIICPWQE
ncbi:purine operon repressor, PurR [Hathewaya proteolytica DSM 3090]|uniref:Purine operon repressor, PurR n=1 Tax=Hathewaya proteolytica DSM 3090 TaxID=1121331 RepID=A0A1M6MAL7_9CLOT|nr:pur operon repressor [Hathewaya proteolytica]SHJ80505.1 purine operon repressor, PurR [Hathewaya proteolytica DSM 3090]